ncbi:MAG: M20/M25/M40 family metallo-hydrolase [Cyclobacteriaceae bacterium]|nr:M20/M25/M40 family metallo-hydrolase [Cyclobacteriaceae bacterium]
MKQFICFLILFLPAIIQAQTKDEAMIRALFDEALLKGQSYAMLDYLSNTIGGRLSGSPEAAAAVEWSKQTMEALKFDHVFLQEVMVPHWVRGNKEVGRIVNSKKYGSLEVNICALGNAVGTGPEGVLAEIVEVHDFEQLEKLGKEGIAGKIVFFNRPMDPTKINTFSAYGGAVNQRGSGASEAAKYGAVGVVIRSMGLNEEDYPHTGSLNYALNLPKIPAVSISTKHADLLSKLRKTDPTLHFYFETHCMMLEEELSYNVIGELKGSVREKQYIVVGGHLDSWDIGDGSHDDGAGCVQSIEALRLLQAVGYKPRHTLRAVMFMNEENGLRGGRKYAEIAEEKKEKHIAAIESDRGGFVPRGFSLFMDDKTREKIQRWAGLFDPYGMGDFNQKGGGADISPLSSQGVPLLGLLPDSQRYFNYHHTAMDTFDTVEKRELEMGAAALAAMLYLIDTYGL